MIPQVKRNKSGFRDYTEDDLRWVEFARCMRSAGLTIETLVEYVNLFQQGAETSAARKEILIEQRKQLIAKMKIMQKSLDRLNYKIERYEQVILEREKELRNPRDFNSEKMS